jgi:hypothetical protein
VASSGGNAAKIAVATGLALGCLLATVVVALAFTALATPLCTVCHSSPTFAEKTGASAHASVECVRCHAGEDVGARISFASSQLFSMTLRLGPGMGRSGAAVPNATCLSCHNGVMSGSTVSKGLMVYHGTCSSGALCTDCHSGTAHGTDVGWLRTYTMTACIRCHSAEQITRACDACHVIAGEAGDETSSSVEPTATVHEPAWSTTHGMGDWDTCAACHSPEYCGSCHGVDLPHPGDFASRHSATVEVAPGSCAKCHTDPFCADCHRMPMPHEKGFTPKHPEIVQASGESVCLGCHLQADCTTCHEGHVHPGGAVAPGGVTP